MSKNLKMFMVFLMIAIIVGVIILVITKKNNNYIIICDGYSDYESKIISSYKDYINFADYIESQNKAYGKVYKFNTKKYNEKYFENKSLAVINIVTGSGMNTLKNIEISINGNLLICKVDIKYAKGVVTDDINGKLLLIEIDKSVTDFKIDKS